MKKIPCLFQRDFTDKRRPVLLRAATPGCEWVLAGEGTPTRKRDGTACLVLEGKLFRRYDCRRGKQQPDGFVPAGDPDPVTGHWPGWVEVGPEPESKWHREAWSGLRESDGARFCPRPELADGTYELCGPKVQGNPERFDEHVLVRHGAEVIGAGVPLDWDGLRMMLESFQGEGIVWHHPDGRMAKLRRDDYGFAWPVPREA